jgi:hypothetical protein
MNATLSAPEFDKRTKEGKALWAELETSGKTPLRLMKYLQKTYGLLNMRSLIAQYCFKANY